MSNRMRNIHLHIRSEYGIENDKIFWQWKKIKCKMVDFQNHRRFSLRCLSEDIIPVSIRLKSNIRTPKGYYVIKKAERALMNERIRSINNTINILSHQRDACKNDLECKIEEKTMKECANAINLRREARHFKALERQRLKFER